VRSSSPWVSDNGDGTFKNPVIYADYSDPDVIRVGDDYFMVSSSFNCSPGIPVLHSLDLVNWKIVGHVFDRLPFPIYDRPQHGKGVWAPSIRYHNGEFRVYYGDPDLGIFLAKAARPEGPWEPMVLVKEARGWIDPCPLWDEDGNAYLVHAWAKSRVGFNSVLTVHRMSPDGLHVLDEGTTVFDGNSRHPTIEGPKFYKQNGYYYTFSPAGGVTNGWQVVLRSRNVFGPYEDKIVLEQGGTSVNGPHQGGWVETQTGESWFVHFQDLGPYGRVVHLQPMLWQSDWPVIGSDPDGNGIGVPVLRWSKPNIADFPIAVPQTSDEFQSDTLGLQWQWHANCDESWSSLKAKRGSLRLFVAAIPESSRNLWEVPNLLLQKFPGPQFSATALVAFAPANVGERFGLLVMGMDYSYIALSRVSGGSQLVRVTCKNADKGNPETEEECKSIEETPLYLKVIVDDVATCEFSFSQDGKKFITMGSRFTARKGKWIGAKIGLFSTAPQGSKAGGYSDVEWFRIE
jgi:beta-xylosidase